MILQGLVLTFMVTLIPALSINAAAQEATAQKSEKEGKLATAKPAPVYVYRLDYTIREMENGKVLNSRKYMLMAESGDWARSRVGNRVPNPSGEKEAPYREVGMNIDCRVREQGEEILLDSRIGLSSVVPREPGATLNPSPFFRSVNSEVTAAVSLGKPTIIGAMDDVTTNQRFEIEVTVTKVK
jgi:hypothetical protein